MCYAVADEMRASPIQYECVTDDLTLDVSRVGLQLEVWHTICSAVSRNLFWRGP